MYRVDLRHTHTHAPITHPLWWEGAEQDGAAVSGIFSSSAAAATGASHLSSPPTTTSPSRTRAGQNAGGQANAASLVPVRGARGGGRRRTLRIPRGAIGPRQPGRWPRSDPAAEQR